MKKNLLTILLIIFVFSISEISASSFADVSVVEPLTEGYYVTIGVYAKSKEHYAKKYTEKAIGMGYKADYGYNSARQYYYVYIFFTRSYKEALDEMRKARQTDEFKDAWVYVHMKNLIGQSQKAEQETIVKKTDVPDQKKESGDDKVTDTADEKETEKGEEKTETVETEEEEVEKGKEITEVEKEEELKFKIHFNVVNARNLEPIEGEVQIIDVERSQLLEAADSGDTVTVTDPNNGTGKLALIVDNFGFRKNQLLFNYYEPDTSQRYIRKEGDHYVVDFNMIRYHKGDIVTMYNVYFFRDASLMKPESKFELKSLLNMMQENPSYKIRIHGHTNGNRPGRIISLGDSDNFFALTEGNKDGFGTAKKLSKERADIVRQYLISNGIEPKRMEIKGWGGKRMVHEKLGHRARHNVRVEIEILKE